MGVTGDRRIRAERVIGASEAACSLREFLTITTEALDEHLGFRESAFMLTLTGDGRAYAGVKHGSPQYVMEEYFERWADDDALATAPARRLFATNGWATITDIYDQLDAPRRRFVDDFLVRIRTPGQLSVRMPGHLSDGYLTLMGPADFDARDRAALLALASALTTRLREWLPAGLEPTRGSSREHQACELVALGFTNREIAGILHVEEDTAKKYVSRALSRLALRSRTELAVAWATGRRLDITGGSAARVGNGAQDASAAAP